MWRGNKSGKGNFEKFKGAVGPQSMLRFRRRITISTLQFGQKTGQISDKFFKLQFKIELK